MGLNRSTWAMPAVLGVASLAGLLVALTGDGMRDIVGWIALCLPLAAIARAQIGRSRRRGSTDLNR